MLEVKWAKYIESVSGSQERLKDLQKISRQMVESLTKALTPNRRVR